jgi:hypothetical protein
MPFKISVTALSMSAVDSKLCPFTDTVDTVVCAPDDGRRYHPKHVEQLPDKITCLTLHLAGYILEFYL